MTRPAATSCIATVRRYAIHAWAAARSPVACADLDPCTIDTCLEKTEACVHTARDADGDGDAVWNCADGGDCDDTDATVSSTAAEVCGNGKDDDCDGQIDEQECQSSKYDTCSDALEITASASVMLSLAAAKLDYPTSCAPANQNLAEVVVALRVPAGMARDVDIVAQSGASDVSLATVTSCGKAPGEQCAETVEVSRGSLSRLHLYGLSPGVYPLYVAGATDADVALTVTYGDASEPAKNETCDQALPITPKLPARVSLVAPKQRSR